MEKYFKKVLNKIIELDKRNHEIDSFLCTHVESDFLRGLAAPIAEAYQPLLIEAISRLWIKDAEVKDAIEYLLYEIPTHKDKKGYIQVKSGKKYTIKDVNTLWDYLIENYEFR